MNQFLEFPNPNLYKEMDWVVLDFETHNLDKGDPRNPENFICLGVAITSEGEYIPLAFPEDTQKLRKLLEGRILIAHNAKFELGWLRRLFSSDYIPPLVFDTLMAEKVLAGNRQWPLDLDSVSLKYGGSVKSRYIKALMENGISPAQMPQGPLLAYCKGDCENTSIVFREQLKLLNQEGLLPVFYTRCLLLWPLVDIEANGIQLDKERVDLEYEQSIKEQSHVLQQLDEYLDGANPNSPKQLAHILYDVLGFEELKRTDGTPQRTPAGSRKADRPTLDLLRARTAAQRNFISLAKSRSKLEKKITGYLNKFRKACDNSQGRIYASLSQINPRTHRLSSQGGTHRVQFQNMDRTLKRLVCPTNPGDIIGEADQCFAAGHKVLCGDLHWKNIEDIRVGDILVGIDENIKRGQSYRGRDRVLRKALVEATRVSPKACLQFVLDSGVTLTVSKEHPFLVRDKHRAAWRWETAQWIQANSHKKIQLRGLCSVYTDTKPREWGKLAAYIDGEGCVRDDLIQITQQAGTDIHKDMEKTLRNLGIPYRTAPYKLKGLAKKPVTNISITGMQHLIRIQQLACPVKMTRKPAWIWENKCPKGKIFSVMDIKDAGVQKVYSIQTTTKTYVCEGVFSHNCQLEFRVAAFLTQDPQAIEDIKNHVDVHSITQKFLEDAGQSQSRTDSKPVTFRPVYGGTGGSKAEREYCKFFKDKYNTMFREQMKWEAEVLRSPDHSLKTASGLKFFWPQVGIRNDGYATDHSSIFNYPVQSLATADILPIGLIYLWYEMKDRGLSSRLINTVHDSTVWEGPKDEEEIIRELCQRNLTSRVIWYLETVYSIKFNVPLEIEISVGSHWGEKSSEAQDNEAVSRSA